MSSNLFLPCSISHITTHLIVIMPCTHLCGFWVSILLKCLLSLFIKLVMLWRLFWRPVSKALMLVVKFLHTTSRCGNHTFSVLVANNHNGIKHGGASPPLNFWILYHWRYRKFRIERGLCQHLWQSDSCKNYLLQAQPLVPNGEIIDTQYCPAHGKESTRLDRSNVHRSSIVQSIWSIWVY
jgi:hypothetical protein